MKRPEEPQGPHANAPKPAKLLRWTVELVTFATSVAAGVGTFTVIYLGPVWYYGTHDVLQWWVWIGGPLGMASGLYATSVALARVPGLVRRLFRR